MNKSFLHFVSITACAFTLSITSPAQASWTCNWFGIGCQADDTPSQKENDSAAEYSKTIDQNNPPKVFAFAVSGSFNADGDLASETVICDTREREDRHCAIRKFVPSLKRNVTVIFKPFAHDLGMYKLASMIESNLGQDPDFRTKESIYLTAYEAEDGVAGFAGLHGKLSISAIAERDIKITVFKGGHYSASPTKNEPIGNVTLKFKGVLK